jgi:TRAP-type mannitol/chloroaromatic compound transport system substrate-binding protein
MTRNSETTLTNATKAPLSRRAALGALAAAPTALAAPALAQAPRTLSLVSTWPRGLPGLATAADRFVERVNTMAAGSLVIELFHAGEKVGAFDSFDAVVKGDADMYHGAEYYWEGRNKAFNFFTTVPFGFTAEEFDAWMQFGGGQQLWDELSAQYGLRCLTAGNTGVQMGGWYARPIRSLSDMKGLRIRIPGLAGDIFRELGSEPVSLPAGGIAAALFAGEIDAVEWVGPYNDLEFGVQKVLTNYMYPGFHEPGTSVGLGINQKVWDSLGQPEQAIIRAAAAAENRSMLAEYSARSGKALEQLQAEFGTNVARFADDIYAEVARITADKISSIAAQDSYSRRVVESFLSFREKVVPYSSQVAGTFAQHRHAWQMAQVKPAPAEEAIVDMMD